MQTKIEIVNTALTLLSVRTIATLEQNLEPARKVKLIFDSTVRDVLRAADWNFATDFVTLASLALLEDDADHVPGWLFTYKYPPNCLRVRRVFNDASVLRRNQEDEKKNHRRVRATSSKEDAIVSNVCEAKAEITFDIVDTGAFDPSFDRALAHKLAFDLAIPLTGDKQIQQAQGSVYASLISEAKRENAEEGIEQVKKTSAYEDSR